MLETNFFLGDIPYLSQWIVPAILAVASIAGGLISSERQKRHNRKLAEYQNQANEELLEKQLEYNKPANQMLRYQEAGLNPNLVYGQGGPGNQSAPLSYPDTAPADMSIGIERAIPLVNQTALAQSQVQATDAKTRQTYVMTEVNKLQKRVLERNPLLDDAGFKAILDSLKSTAEIKASDAAVTGAKADWFTGEKSFNVDGVRMHGPAGVIKMETELKNLIQQFDLGQADQKLKAEVLKSKEFQNAILNVQARWMTDAEVTPQHIMQFLQLLLLKIL